MTFDDVAKLALALPEVSERARQGKRTWFVRAKAFAWERPLTKPDLKRLEQSPPPEGSLLAVRVASLEAKEVALQANPASFFTISHFDGFGAVLIRLDSVHQRALGDAIMDAWLACAPPALRRQFLSTDATRFR